MIRGKINQAHFKNRQEIIQNQLNLDKYSLCFKNKKNFAQKLFSTSSRNLHQVNQKFQSMRKLQNQNIRKHLNMVGQTIQRIKLFGQFKKKLQSLENSLIEQFHVIFTKIDQLMEYEIKNKQCMSKLKEKYKDLVPQFEKFNGGKLDEKENIQIFDSMLKENKKEFEISMNCVKKKFITIKDYCIKIIEVIMNSDQIQDDFQDQQSFQIVNKFYQRHKEYIYQRKNRQIIDQEKVQKLHVQTQTDFNNNQDIRAKIKNKQILDMENIIKRIKKENESLYFQNINLREELDQGQKVNNIKRIIRNPQKKSLNTTLNSQRSNRKHF